MDMQTPKDEQFKDHFEKLLNPPDAQNVHMYETNMDNLPYIPVSYEPFSMNKLNQATKDLNKDKSYAGICPALLSALDKPVMFLLTIFNAVFTLMCYSTLWC